jgi:ABC-type phosphate transport system permease subunit
MIELGYVVIALVAVVAVPLGFSLAVYLVRRSLKEGGSAGTPPRA